MINARNSTYYFDAENKCKNENSILVSTLEPEFSPLYVKKLKEYDKNDVKYQIRNSILLSFQKFENDIWGSLYKILFHI